MIIIQKHLEVYGNTTKMILMITCVICVITNSTGAGKFAITEAKLYVPVVTFSTKDNAKLL